LTVENTINETHKIFLTTSRPINNYNIYLSIFEGYIICNNYENPCSCTTVYLYSLFSL